MTGGPPGSRLVTAGRVLLGDGGALDDAAVLVEHGRIAWVGRAAEAGRLAYRETDSFPGGCLVPGFIDAHVHLCFGYGADLTVPTKDPAALARTVALHCRRLLAAGVTGVRDLGGVGGAVQQARDAIARGELDGPRIRCSGRPVTTAGGHLSSFGLAASGEEAVTAAVAAVAGAGADTVKIVATGGAGTPGTPLGRAQFSTAELRAAVRAAAGLGLPVAAHAHGTEGIERAVAAGVHTVEHCSWMDLAGEIGRPDPAVLAEMRRRRQIAVIAGPLPPALAGRPASLAPGATLTAPASAASATAATLTAPAATSSATPATLTGAASAASATAAGPAPPSPRRGSRAHAGDLAQRARGPGTRGGPGARHRRAVRSVRGRSRPGLAGAGPGRARGLARHARP